ncbi:MAG TPA: phenylalanine--tRNA ligase subunit beta [Tissierellaceae bacterium]|nr:phenylalanine--tRNA ligase subunit beta [Tissierellaceae bacterium]
MLLPVNWLKNYVDLSISSKEIADGLTYSGSHVESITSMNKGIENVVVAKLESIETHPNADKLLVCKASTGPNTYTVVTGAKNLKSGDYVPLALPGAKLPGGIEIGITDFRGVESQGMLCSLKELGYADNVIPKEMRDGIFVFDKDYELGQDVVNLMQLDDDIIEFEITPNRPDCLSIYGMAREASATFNGELQEPEIEIENEVDDIHEYTNGIEVKTEACRRYYSRVIKDVVIKPSPLWMQTTLMNAGVRPVNNMVDITNYVMLELGEPLHAFDLDMLGGRKIIVRQAEAGEKLTTLDDVERILDQNDVVIADENTAIGLAGIMGGLDSEITKETKTVLLEGANFSPRHVRLTSKKLALRSEASTRFEKGIDPNLCSQAVERVCELVEKTGAGKVVKGVIDVDQTSGNPHSILMRPERARMLLGVEIPDEDLIDYLERLRFKTTVKEGNIIAEVPSYRDDVKVEADLIEEAGRLYGFHNIESKPLKGGLTRGEKPYNKQIKARVKSVLQGIGYNEVMTYSFISPKAYDKLNLPEDAPERNYIRLMNPLGEDYSTMRTTLMSNMMDLLGRNENKGIEEVFAYEIGYTFIPKSLPVVDLPEEKQVLSIGFYGDKDFYYMKETLEMVFSRLGIKNLDYRRLTDNYSFHPGRAARVYSGDDELGVFGEVHPDVAGNYELKNRPYVATINFDKVVELTDLDIKYKPLPKYPSMTRDIAVVVDEDIMVGELEEVIIHHGKDLVESIDLFDIYRGNQVEKNKKSVAFSIVYRSYEGTLTDSVVNKIQTSIIEDLENKFDAKLRS